jgi:hypothetical protein
MQNWLLKLRRQGPHLNFERLIVRQPPTNEGDQIEMI